MEGVKHRRHRGGGGWGGGKVNDGTTISESLLCCGSSACGSGPILGWWVRGLGVKRRGEGGNQVRDWSRDLKKTGPESKPQKAQCDCCRNWKGVRRHAECLKSALRRGKDDRPNWPWSISVMEPMWGCWHLAPRGKPVQHVIVVDTPSHLEALGGWSWLSQVREGWEEDRVKETFEVSLPVLSLKDLGNIHVQVMMSRESILMFFFKLEA